MSKLYCVDARKHTSLLWKHFNVLHSAMFQAFLSQNMFLHIKEVFFACLLGCAPIDTRSSAGGVSSPRSRYLRANISGHTFTILRTSDGCYISGKLCASQACLGAEQRVHNPAQYWMARTHVPIPHNYEMLCF